jgi:hypothetical protein
MRPYSRSSGSSHSSGSSGSSGSIIPFLSFPWGGVVFPSRRRLGQRDARQGDPAGLISCCCALSIYKSFKVFNHAPIKLF